MKKIFNLAAISLLFVTSSALAYKSGQCNAMTNLPRNDMTHHNNSKIESIAQAAIATSDLSTLVAALKAAGLVETLSGKGPFTVFAPTNEAFNKLPEGKVNDLLKPENKDTLVSVLKKHVVSGEFTQEDLKEMGMVKNLDGKNLMLAEKNGELFVNEASVLQEVSTGNGMVYVIDSVITQ